MRWFKEFCSGCKNLNNQARSGKFKTVDSEAVLQAIEANLPSRSRKVLSKFRISPELSNCNSRKQNLSLTLVSSSLERIAKHNQRILD